MSDGIGAVQWRKSSYSNHDGGNCVEVADGFRDTVPVRDSKSPQGPVLAFGSVAWSSFVSSVRRGGRGAS